MNSLLQPLRYRPVRQTCHLVSHRLLHRRRYALCEFRAAAVGRCGSAAGTDQQTMEVRIGYLQGIRLGIHTSEIHESTAFNELARTDTAPNL